jgi:hypothetical protein
MIIHKWISSDGSELVPTTDVKINLTLPNTFKSRAGTIRLSLLEFLDYYENSYLYILKIWFSKGCVFVWSERVCGHRG